jgi:hypothetical protein
MIKTEFIFSVRRVLVEKAPFLVTAVTWQNDPNRFNTYLVRPCVSMDELRDAFYLAGINPYKKNFKKSLLDPSNHYIIVNCVHEYKYDQDLSRAVGRAIEKEKFRKLTEEEKITIFTR